MSDDKECLERNDNVENIDNVDKLLLDINNAVKIKELVLENNGNTDKLVDLSINATLDKSVSALKNINSIKEELCKLPLDPCEQAYFNNSVLPFLQTIDELSRASFNLSATVSVLTTSPIVSRKKSKLKDTIDLIYDMNDKCEDIYKVLHRRINILLDLK